LFWIVEKCLLVCYQQAKLEQAADRPGTAQHHRRVLASLNKQLGESRQRQEKAEEEYRTKKEEALQLKSQLDEVSGRVTGWQITE